jgi:hypothetical protein
MKTVRLSERLINRVVEGYCAEFAPLSKAHLLWLLQRNSQEIPAPLFSLAPQLGRTPEERWLDQIWEAFTQARNTVYSYIAPFALAEGAKKDLRITTPWLSAAIRENDPEYQIGRDPNDFTPDAPTMKIWRDHGLIRGDWNRPDRNWASALLILRAMIIKRRRWRPSDISPDEPFFWVWSIGPGEDVPVSYPILSASLDPEQEKSNEGPPRNRLWYTPWPLAGVLPGWKMFHKRGAYRWSRRSMVNGKYLWDLTLEEVKAWNAPLDYNEEELARLQRPYGKLSMLTTAEKALIEREYLHPHAEKLLEVVGTARLTNHLEQHYSLHSPSPFSQLYLDV